VHISDTHSYKYHEQLIIPECDVLIHSGDIGGRTTPKELEEFLVWFSKQPAERRIFIAGNHDICLDKEYPQKLKDKGDIFGWSRAIDNYKKAVELIDKFSSTVKYLHNKEYIYEGVKFWGSPYTPSFHKENWALNKDRGNEINREWVKIPTDTNVLIVHGPPYGILDVIPEEYKLTEDEDLSKGCADLLARIYSNLHSLKLVCFGHIHSQTGILVKERASGKPLIYSNGAVITNNYKQLIINPLMITL